MSKSKTGFTIVELLIVIVIIGILAAISIVAYNGIQERSRASAASSALSQASKKIKVWQVDNPSTSPADLATVGVSNGGDVSYQYTAGTSGAYCITATSGATSYTITESTKPSAGGCAGHGVGGKPAVTNLVTNPSVETNSTGWSANWGTSATGNAVRMTDGGWNGNAYFRMTWTASATVTWGGVNLANIAATEGQSLTASVWVRSSSAQTLRLYLRPNTYPTGGDTAGSAINVPINTWTRLSVTLASSPAGITSYTPFTSRSSAGTWVAGDVFDSDGLMITQGTTLYNYADGNSSNWVWNGTANNSTSTGPPL